MRTRQAEAMIGRKVRIEEIRSPYFGQDGHVDQVILSNADASFRVCLPNDPTGATNGSLFVLTREISEIEFLVFVENGEPCAVCYASQEDQAREWQTIQPNRHFVKVRLTNPLQ